MRTAAPIARTDPRRAMLAVMVAVSAACVLGTSPSAPANSASVIVTARISPVFSLSLLTSAEIDFGDVEIGSRYERPGAVLIEVRSNREWEFLDSSNALLIVGEHMPPRDTFLRHGTSLAFGPARPAGIHRISCDYSLDLTPVEAFDLPADAALSTVFGYTAVQK